MNFEILKQHTPRISDYKDSSEFAVLVPIVKHKEQACIVFQVRSGRLNKQPNEICFPGGKIEPNESPLHAAIRETCEELLIEKSSIEILGEIDTLVTPFNTIIYPFAAYLNDYQNTYSKDEVEEVFYVPIEFLMSHTPKCSYLDVIMQPHDDFPFEKVQYGRDYPWAKGKYPAYFYEYENKIIWGITARILKNFIELISK
ncbi:MAG: putative nudix hydrolase YeaB [Clostridia bacterium]|jgi:8-oxo-dGTP pyrophosphatase MutT (NUDIX family)|nr:putative nudix hydrolase YeaB [Clostridia bacterium]